MDKLFASFAPGDIRPVLSPHPWCEQEHALIVDSYCGVDAKVILAAYCAWGIDCARHLCGDYAFILWDDAQSLLLAGRSITGRCPFYYAQTPDNRLLCASDPTILLAHGVPALWDDRWIAHWLTQSEDHWRYSPWRSVHPLLPGHCLVYQRGQTRIKSCWSPPARLRTTEMPFEDAATQFRTQLVQAITTRMSGQKACSFDCSGGLDSTSITATAAFLQEQGDLDLGTIHAYHGYSAAYPEEDARVYIAEMVERYPTIEPHFLAFDRLRALPLEVRTCSYPSLRSVLMPAYPDEMERQLSAQGSTGHFSGAYGDQIFSSTLRSFWHQPIWRWPDDLWQWRSLQSSSSVLSHAWLAERSAHKLRPIASWIAPEAAEIVKRSLAQQEILLRRWLPDPFQRALIAHIMHDQSLLTSDLGREGIGRLRLFPYLDQRLLEFLCQCPTPWLMAPGPGARKGLLREAMRGILPERVRLRPDKGNATRVISAWSRQQSEALKALASEATPIPFLDQEGLIAAIARMGYGDCRDQRFVYHALAICVERR